MEDTGEPGRNADRIAKAVIGAAIEVHRCLGPGFLEAVYEEALVIEMEARVIPFERQVRVSVMYRTKPVGTGVLDLLVGRCVIVELKAVDALAPIHIAQTLSYLRTTGCRLALLINFNVPMLRDGIKRVILSS